MNTEVDLSISTFWTINSICTSSLFCLLWSLLVPPERTFPEMETVCIHINFILLQQFSKVGFFYKSNSLNPLRYSRAKETDTQKSWVILQSFNSFTIKLTKTLIAKLPHAKCFFCINVSFMIKELKFCKIAQLFCLSVFLAR